MARNRNFSRREERKELVELVAVPDLGVRITMPRKTNRAPASTVASGDRFWDNATGALQAPQKTTDQQLDELINVARLPWSGPAP